MAIGDYQSTFDGKLINIDAIGQTANRIYFCPQNFLKKKRKYGLAFERWLALSTLAAHRIWSKTHAGPHFFTRKNSHAIGKEQNR